MFFLIKWFLIFVGCFTGGFYLRRGVDRLLGGGDKKRLK